MTIIIFLFHYIPLSTGLIHIDTQNAYVNLMDKHLVGAFNMLVVMFISDMTTSALMAWSKFHWNGRHIVIRVLLLHIISEIIIISSGFITDPINGK